MKTRMQLTGLSILAACIWTASVALSQGGSQDLPFTYQSNVMVAMSDGTRLAANLFLPREGGPFPVILMRTPYGKMDEKSDEARQYCSAGYAMVVQDCRGRGGSQGVWDPFRYDLEDGFETQEWIGRQPWCNGRIGTSGG